MSKYIRTKDGVYEIKGANLINKSFTIYKGERQCFVKEKDILKQADTIEELIDGYVIVDVRNKNDKPRFQEEPWGKPPLHLLKDDYEIYGSIWIGADLHAVAKLNDKGELELL